MLILGLESSCDETAAAVVRSDRTILSSRIAGQEDAHRPYGGVVPEIAARAHVEMLTPLVEAALEEAGVGLAGIDAIAATAGPGLIGGVMVGLVTGKALALAAGKPLIAVNHLEGHALSPRLVDPALDFPYLLLLVSGGHSQLLAVDGVSRYRRLATTIDDAVGEAFDKVAKILGLGFPGGPGVERAAKEGDPARFKLPRPLVRSEEPHFSFAGLKTAVLRAHQAEPDAVADLAASFQAAAVDCLADGGVAEGTGGGRYAPADQVTRLQMASFTARLLRAGGVTLPSDPPDAFDDDEGTVHELALNQLTGLGVVQGTGEAGRTFYASTTMKRDRMAAWMARAYALVAGHQLASTSTDYFGDDSAVHHTDINRLAAAGVVQGTAPGTYSPRNSVRRDQMASYLARTLAAASA